MFKESVHDYNENHYLQIEEKPEYKGGFDYFSHPNIASGITKRLGYQPADIEDARKKMCGETLQRLENETSKCDLSISTMKNKERSVTAKLDKRIEVNKFYYRAQNEAELATLGIKIPKKPVVKKRGKSGDGMDDEIGRNDPNNEHPTEDQILTYI